MTIVPPSVRKDLAQLDWLEAWRDPWQAHPAILWEERHGRSVSVYSPIPAGAGR